MKLLLVLCALVAVVAASYGVNTASQDATYDQQKLPHPGYNRVYDEFDGPIGGRRRHHYGGRPHRHRHSDSSDSDSDSGSDSDSHSHENREKHHRYRDRYDEPLIVLHSNPGYGGPSNDAPAHTPYGSPSNDAPAHTPYGSPSNDAPANTPYGSPSQDPAPPATFGATGW